MSMYWQGLTTKGAVTGGVIGLVAAILLMVFGPAVWVDVLGNEQPIFPQAYPALFSVSLAFFTMWVVSIFDRSEQAAEDRSKFEIMKAA